MFTTFEKYMTSFPVSDKSTDLPFVQRLKMLASASNLFVQYNVVEENRVYQVYTEHEMPLNVNQTFSEYNINELVPFRSATLDFSNGFKILDYSINRVVNLTNDDFLVKANTQTFKAYTSYEGSVLVARHDGSKWILRTTSKYSANDSTFGSFCSFGEVFNQVCISKGYENWTYALDALRKQYNEHYFVFVLVSKNHQYLCDYPQFKNGSEVFLINVRNLNTHIDVDIQQSVFLTSNEVTNEHMKQSLDSNKKFENKLVNLQGFVLKDSSTGQVYKTLTGAYFFASSQILNNPNPFLRSLFCFCKGSLPTYNTLYNIPRDVSLTTFNQCKNTLSGVRNLVAYMFSIFTDFNINSITDGFDEHNKPKFKMEKSYQRKNSDFYTKLFDVKDTNLQVYKRALAGTQKFSLKPNVFTDSSQLAFDVEKYLRSLAYNDKTFNTFVDLLLSYEKFKTHLCTVTLEYNDGITALRKQARTAGDTTKHYYINMFSNNNEATLLTVCKTYFQRSVTVQTNFDSSTSSSASSSASASVENTFNAEP
jgi:hypothetical protein